MLDTVCGETCRYVHLRRRASHAHEGINEPTAWDVPTETSVTIRSINRNLNASVPS